MRVVILAGGRGTRLAEETAIRPKPMIEIGEKPLLWHIMMIYASYGFRDFVIACGYKGDLISQYFSNGGLPRTDRIASSNVEVIDTGLDTQTGGRIHQLADRLSGATFMVTYGDGVGNIDVGQLMTFHRSHGKRATITAVRPPSRFGALTLEGDCVREYVEKPQTGEGWINGGFFVFEPSVLDYLNESSILEREPLERLAREGELKAYQHTGFWQPVDTLREKEILESLWFNGEAPWKVW